MGIFGNRNLLAGGWDVAPTATEAAPINVAEPAQKPETRRGGIFGNMSGQNKWLMLAQILGGGRNTLPLQFMMQQRQAEQERLAAQEERQNRFEDWQRQFDYQANYEAQHPNAPAPDVFTRTMQAAGIDPNSPEGVAMYRRRAEMMTNPVQLLSDGMGGYSRVSTYGGGDDAPTAPVGALVPIDEGDGGSNAPGGFRPGF